MWEHGGCLESFQQVPILKHDHLDHHDVGTCKLRARCVHVQIIESGWDSNLFVRSSLVDMYAKCESMENAWKVINNVPSQNVVSWNAILGGCVMHGHGKEALKHFDQMHEEGVQPGDITFVYLLSACSRAGLVDEGMC
jgi:pentatricopeptide repeat protein